MASASPESSVTGQEDQYGTQTAQYNSPGSEGIDESQPGGLTVSQ